MSKKLALLFLLVLCAGAVDLRFIGNQRRRAASGFKDNFEDITWADRAALFWTVLRWPGPRMAPEGIYYVIHYISVPTPSGPVGLLPGQEVHVVREAGPRIIVRVPAVTGPRELELARTDLTDDLDLASHLAGSDRAAQATFRATLAAEQARRERVRLGLYVAAAADLESAERARLAPGSGAAVGTRVTVLQQQATAHGGPSYAPVPMYYPGSTTTSVPASQPGASTASSGAAGASSSGGSAGGSFGPRSTSLGSLNPQVPTYTTWKPGSAPPTARAQPSPTPGVVVPR